MEYNLPPQAIEAEQHLLGALLVSPDSYDKVGGLSVNDFYRNDHGRIFGAIGRLLTASKPIDVLTVFESVKNESIGFDYLVDLASNVASAANIGRYAEIIIGKSRLRRLQAAFHEALEQSFDPQAKASEVIDGALSRLIDMADDSGRRDEPRPLQEILGAVIDKVQERYENPGKMSGIPTGFIDLDEITGGLQNGDLIILGGRPGMGKSAVAMNIAENIALDGGKVLVFSIEMPDQQLATRMISSVGGVASKGMRDGRLTEEDWSKLTYSLGRLHEAPMFIDDSAGITVQQMHSKARKLKRKSGLDFIVIDYLQLIKSTSKSTQTNDHISEISRAIKLMAKDLKVPVLCLSQLSRGLENRADKKPIMSDLRDSGAIEQDADIVAFMYRDDYYNPGSHLRGYGELLIRKHRNGECGDIPLIFKAEISKFLSADKTAFISASNLADTSPKKQSKSFRGES